MTQEHLGPTEADAAADVDEPRDRCSVAELTERQTAAGELLIRCFSTSAASRAIAERYGVSLRQARRYTRIAALDRCGDGDVAALDIEILLIAENMSEDALAARDDGDRKTAAQIEKARAAMLTQFRKAVAPVRPQRIRLPTARSKPELPW